MVLVSLKGLAEGGDGVQKGDWPHDGGAHYFQQTALMLVTREIHKERRVYVFRYSIFRDVVCTKIHKRIYRYTGTDK